MDDIKEKARQIADALPPLSAEQQDVLARTLRPHALSNSPERLPNAWKGTPALQDDRKAS